MKATILKGILSRAAGFTLLITTAFSTTSQAQVTFDSTEDQTNLEIQIPDPCKSESRMGVKGGLNMFNFENSGANEEFRKVGFNAGIYYNLRVNHALGFRAELLASHKGGHVFYNNKFGTGVADFRLNYLEMPVLVQYAILPNLRLQVGPYVSYLVKARVKRENSGMGVNESGLALEQNIGRSSFTAVDLGYAVGVEYTCSGVNFGFRITEGLKPVGNNPTYFGQQNTFSNFSNSVRQVYVGYAF